ncbi:MAG: ABC transporter permease [Chloroflexi bacterium]|nr:ABC transporter permease [Chloroflexota bacterium]
MQPPTGSGGAGSGVTIRRRWRRAWRKETFAQSLTALIGGLMVALVVLASIFAEAISPHDPLAQEITQRLRPPFWMEGGTGANLLGTDSLGRDILSRMIFGSRISLIVGFSAVIVAGTIGVTLGMLAAYFKGAVDLILSRIADIQQAIPFLILIIAVVAVVGASLLNLILVLGVGSWLFYYRVVRGETLSVREEPYVEAARIVGCTTPRILFRYILPNVSASIIVIGTLFVPQVILFEAGLSFLGLGVQPPTPTWGGMIAEGRDYVASAWWLSVVPGFAIMLTVLGINLVGDWLREVLDPRQSKGR